MTSMSRVTITMPEPLLARIKEAVRQGAAASVSAYVAEHLVHNNTLDDVLAEMVLRGGAPTQEDYDTVDAALGLSKAEIALADRRRPA